MDDSALSDGELVARCLEARGAFEQIYRRYAPRLYAFLRGLHRDEHRAADLLQETFLKAYRGLPGFDRSRPLEPWLFQIARNLSRDARRRARAPEARDPASLGLASRDRDRLADRDSFDRIADRAGLPERSLSTFLLARGQGLSYREIAAIHGCSEVTVKRDLARASEALARAAHDLGEPQP